MKVETKSATIGLVKQRIQKILAAAGVASRRAIEEMVRQGRIAVNGKIQTELPILIDPGHDKVTVDDEPIRLATRQGREVTSERLYLLMNKPKDVHSTNVAQGEQKRAIDLLPPGHPRVYPVGRLDAESKGLLLLTNDGELTNRLTHPKYGVPKTYRAVVDGFVDSAMLVEELGKGIWLGDRASGKGFKTARTHVKVVKRGRETSVLELTLREGRNRQVRRMLAQLGHKVRDLTRIRMGPLTLEGLAVGHVRKLSPREVKELKKFGAKLEERATERDREKSQQSGRRD
jgi:23S rRNA pseudouridine2605 synthase